MSKVNNIPTVTSKDTKTVILEAYEAAVKVIKELENQKFDPVQIKTQKENKTLIESATKTIKSVPSLLELVNNLKANATIELEQIVQKVIETTEKYNDLDKAMILKQKELEDIFGLTDAAYDVAAMVQAKENMLKYYSEKNEADIKLAKEQLEAIRIECANDREAARKEIKELDDASLKRRKDEEEEWAYEFERSKKRKENELADNLANLKKAEETKAIEIREEAKKVLNEAKIQLNDVQDKAIEFEAMQAEIEYLPERIKEATDKAVQQKEKELNHKFYSEKAIIEKDKESQLAIKDNRIKMLEEKIAEMTIQIASSNEKLDNAYKEIKDLSQKAVEATRPQIYSQQERK